jgi:hypothetical protein
MYNVLTTMNCEVNIRDPFIDLGPTTLDKKQIHSIPTLFQKEKK